MKTKRPFLFVFSVVLCIFSLFPLVHAQKIDEEYNRKLRAYTTDDRFLPASILDLMDDPRVPSPLKHFGDIAGAPKVQHNTTQIYGYFAALAASSDRIRWEQIGTSEEGRAINLAIIADEVTLTKLDHYKQQLARLADPRKLDIKDLEKVLDDSKLIYFINGGLHSPETGSPEMLTELAYRLVTGTQDEIREIRENIIVLINPVSEPDGWDRQTDWYYRYSIHREKMEDGGMRNPPFWGKYTVHDNNRDGIQVSQELTKAAMRTYLEYHPTILLDLHESLPLLYISSGTGPYNETIDPITINEWHMLASHEATQLAVQHLPGVFTWAFYDGWNPGYLFWIANNRNSIGRFYETYGNAGSNTFLRDISTSFYAGDPANKKEWYRPDPAPAKVMWSIRNNLNYMQAGVLAGLQYAAKNSRQLLSNFYRKSFNSWQKGLTESPRAFVIPRDQRDPNMAAYLVNNLRTQGIEVHEAVSGDKKGDFVVLMDQPYRNHAYNLLSIQKFPADAKYPSYDDVAWTLGYLYGVEVKETEKLEHALADLQMVSKEVVVKGVVEGSGSRFALNYKAQSQVLPLLYKAKSQSRNLKIFVLDESGAIGGDQHNFGPGSLILEGLSAKDAQTLAAEFGLDLQAVGSGTDPVKREIRLPRIAVYQSWTYTQDEGWVRFTLDQMKIPYTSIHKDHLKAGNLNEQFDVILVPRIRGSVSDFIHEIDTKWGPMPYTKTAQFPSHGFPAATDDMTGGPGFDGIAHLATFVKNGGVLVPFDNSSLLVAQTGIGRELNAANTAGLNHPGSIVRVRSRDLNSKILYGYPEVFEIFRGNGPLLTVNSQNRDLMVLQYGVQVPKADIPYSGPIMGGNAEIPSVQPVVAMEEGRYNTKDYPYLVSGMVQNQEQILGQGAIFNVPVGKGRLVAFTFNPMHRYLTHHNMSMVWNTLINWQSL